LKEIIDKYNIKLFFLTNLLGFCGDIDNIAEQCNKDNIIFIEDNCEGLGSVYKGKKLGNFSLASTFSFYVGHHLSTIEGGAVCTNDAKLAQMLRIVRAHGWDRNLSKEEQKMLRIRYDVLSDFYAKYTFYDLGFNFRPTEITGFLGNVQIKYIENIILKRNNNFLKLADKIYKYSEKYYSVEFEHMDFVSNFAFPVICRSKKIRDDLIKKCDGKIEVRPIVGGNITRQPFYKKYVDSVNVIKNPNADFIHSNGIYFGNNPELTHKEIDTIIKIFIS
jgi:CDP-6-deoxy-D-xylo-4-hexulose-3-dehydrase